MMLNNDWEVSFFARYVILTFDFEGCGGLFSVFSFLILCSFVKTKVMQLSVLCANHCLIFVL